MPRGHRERDVVQWVFDPLPASGARRGGDPASHVFRQSVSSFVREVVQNANDQRVDAPEVHFRFVEVEGEALERLRDALSWPTLSPHLRAAAATRGGAPLREFLTEHDKRKKLLVLVIEDRNTVGLTGGEVTGDSHFRALCKDTLFSHKQTESAGGSYGLGKSILWAFSGLSTVLFLSNLSAEANGQESPRLFGRAELPTHALDKSGEDAFAGSGWFGRRVDSKAGVRAESVWAERAAELAVALGLKRSETYGTSIGILGFRDPTRDEDRSLDSIATEIRDSVEREFWPAMVMPGEPLVTWIAAGRPAPILPNTFKLAKPFADAYRARGSGRTVLETAGDVVVREIELEIPGRRDGAPAVRGTVRLCVRLSEEADPGPMSGHVAWFRGPGMVVRYTDRRSLAVGVRPFHAIVACGDARHPEVPTESDHAIERFLRAAEPPGHDVWESTAALKSDYKPGYAKALDLLRRRVDEELKSIVVAQPRRGRQGPDRLRKRFPLGQRGGRGSGKSAFKFREVAARMVGDRWTFQAEVRPAHASARWQCTLRVTEVSEDGGELLPLALARITAQKGDVQIVDGVATIVVTASLLKIEGETTAIPAHHGRRRAIQLEIRGVEVEP